MVPWKKVGGRKLRFKIITVYKYFFLSNFLGVPPKNNILKGLSSHKQADFLGQPQPELIQLRDTKKVQMGKSEFIVPDSFLLINKSNGTNCK